MMNLFLRGGPIMWPLLLTSIITLSVVMERLFFVVMEKHRRNRAMVDKVLDKVERGDLDSATQFASENSDVVTRVLAEGLKHRSSLVSAMLSAASEELKRTGRGLSVLDTAITLAPLLGLLGTVTGLIRAFSFLGNQELGAPTAITGGIAQALIATAFGLSIAILALVPFNYLNSHLEQTRHEIESATTQLEILMARANPAKE